MVLSFIDIVLLVRIDKKNTNRIIVKQNYDKCFTNNELRGKIELQKRSDDYGTGND